MEWFKQLHLFLDSVENGAKDAAKQGTTWLRSMCDKIDDWATGAVESGEFPSDAELEACGERCRELAASAADPTNPKKIDPATIMLILQLVTTIIEAIRKRRNPQPPAPPA